MRALAVAALALLAACGQVYKQPKPAPALWEVTGSDGQKGFLFGTAHSLPDGVVWRTPMLDRAFDLSEVLVVEVAELEFDKEAQAFFESLSSSRGLPPLLQRVDADKRDALKHALDRAKLEESDFGTLESWAVAIRLSQAYRLGSPANGVDLDLIERAGTKDIVELEGMRSQLEIFDRLPEGEQADMLELSAQSALNGRNAAYEVLSDWIAGDLDSFEDGNADGSLAADPELREALLVARNRAWTAKIDAALRGGKRTFVAVGALHTVGKDGLPAQLEAIGYTVERIQ